MQRQNQYHTIFTIIASSRHRPRSTKTSKTIISSNSMLEAAWGTRVACDLWASGNIASLKSVLRLSSAVLAVGMWAPQTLARSHKASLPRCKCSMARLVGKRRTFHRRISSGEKYRLQTNQRSSSRTTCCRVTNRRPSPTTRRR